MISFEDVLKLIRTSETPNLRIFDSSGRMQLMEIEESSAEQAIDKLEEYKDSFKLYGSIIIEAATAQQKKGNYKSKFTWKVQLAKGKKDGDPPPLPYPPIYQMGTPPAGMISQQTADLQAKVAILEMEKNFESKLQALQDQIKNTNNNDPMRYLPIAGMFLDIDPKKLQTAMSLAQLQGLMSGNGAMAGLQTQQQQPKLSQGGVDQPTRELTPEQQALCRQMEKDMDTIAQEIGVDRVSNMVGLLAKNPQLLQQLEAAIIQMSNNSNPS